MKTRAMDARAKRHRLWLRFKETDLGDKFNFESHAAADAPLVDEMREIWVRSEKAPSLWAASLMVAGTAWRVTEKPDSKRQRLVRYYNDAYAADGANLGGPRSPKRQEQEPAGSVGSHTSLCTYRDLVLGIGHVPKTHLRPVGLGQLCVRSVSAACTMACATSSHCPDVLIRAPNSGNPEVTAARRGPVSV